MFGRKRQFIGNFEKIFENVENFPSQNYEKCIILTYFSKKFNKPCVIFCAIGRQNKLQKTFEKFFKIFLQKIAKKSIIYAYFSKNLTNHALIFCGFGLKKQFIRNFEKIFENFERFSSENR